MIKDLVSIITPCHNSAEFIEKLFSTILFQTYPSVEMFCIDNASTDNTAEIIKFYIPKFEENGYKLTYIYQGDMGPSGGVKTGLQKVQGEFLLTPDSDDWYKEEDFIERLVNKFHELPENYAILRCQDEMIEQYSEKHLGYLGANMTEGDMPNLFEDCLFGRSDFVYAAIGYMYKTEKIRELTNMDIYAYHDSGPNRQILMPLLYEYKCYNIAEPLACYLVRQKSMSHGEYAKYELMVNLMKNDKTYIDAIFKTIPSIQENDKQKYFKQFLACSGRNGMLFTVNFGNKQDFAWFYNEVKENDSLKFNDQLLRLIVGKRFLMRLYNLIKRIKAKVS
jgi:glycosyltransferase involved in cell wall biosynthesis